MHLLFLIFIARCSNALIGYDCNTPYDNGTIVSLLEDDTCHLNEEDLILHDVPIEMLHHPRITTVNVLSCRIEIEYVINNPKNKNNNVINNKRHYVPVGLSSCISLNAHGIFQFGNSTFDTLVKNDVNSRLIYPSDEALSIPSENLKIKETVNTYIHIVYKNYFVKVDLLINKILLNVGTTCTYTNLECTDEEGFQNFWSPVFLDKCEKSQQSIIYRGTAKRMQSIGHSSAYALKHNNVSMILFIRTQHSICNVTVLQTEHPRIVVKEVSEEYLKNQKYVNKIRFLAYSANSYINVITNDNLDVKNVYISQGKDRCIKREMELHTSLIMAQKDPSLFAYSFMGMPGYSAYIRGEAAQLFQCTAVPARIRTTGDCFLELPVTVNGQPMYLQPKTRTITTRGTEITCNPLATAMYRIKSQWHTLTPKPEESKTVPTPKNLVKTPWNQIIDTLTITVPMLSVHVEMITAANTQPVRENISAYIIKICTITATISTLILLSLIIVLRIYRKWYHSPSLQQPCEYTQDYRQHARKNLELHDTETSAELTYNNYRKNQEAMQCAYYLQQETGEMSREIYNLKTSYQDLEKRLNKCTSPMQAGFNRLTVASSRHRCSQLNEGGVTADSST